MGKKTRKVEYDRKRLNCLAFSIANFRKPIEEGEYPVKKVELSELEKAIWQLPKKERESLEKFWGLIPGSVDHSKDVNTKKSQEVAYKNMLQAALKAMRILLSIEYVFFYDKKAQELMEQYLSKVNRSGVEYISDIDVIKYMILLWTFFCGGPKMVFENADSEINLQYDEMASLDEYSLLYAGWEEMVKNLPDGAINLKLLLEAIDMFDVKDVVSMKRFVRLPIERAYSRDEKEEFEKLKQIRLLKESIFPDGEWETIEQLIYGNKTKEIDFEELSDALSILRCNWKMVEKYKIGTKAYLLSTGKKELPVYDIAGLRFTDTYEIMFLSVCRSL